MSRTTAALHAAMALTFQGTSKLELAPTRPSIWAAPKWVSVRMLPDQCSLHKQRLTACEVAHSCTKLWQSNPQNRSVLTL